MDNGFGEYLRNLRIRRGWTIGQLEARSGVSDGYLSQLENGKRQPSPKILQKLAPALKEDLQEMMTIAGHLPRVTKQPQTILEALEEKEGFLDQMASEAPTPAHRQFLEEIRANVGDQFFNDYVNTPENRRERFWEQMKDQQLAWKSVARERKR